MFLKLVTSLLPAFTTPVLASSRAGNGGDLLRIQFEGARSVAATQLMKLGDERIAAVSDSHAIAWLKLNRLALAEDIMKSKHDWTGKHETCAQTQLKPSVISFSLESCARTFRSMPLGSFAKLLIHESVHHFGIDDETFADQVAIAVFSLFFTTYECHYRFNGSFHKIMVDDTQQHRFVNIDKFRIRFSNYQSVIYVDIVDTSENKRKAKLSLTGEYLAYYPNDSLPSLYCVRL